MIIGAPVASSGSAAVAITGAGGRRGFCSGGEKGNDDFRSKCREYLLKIWKYYSTHLAVPVDHKNRVATFVGFTIAIVCTLLALDQRQFDVLMKDVKEVLKLIQNLTEVVNNRMETLTKLMNEMREKLELQEEEEEKGKKEGGDKPGK